MTTSPADISVPVEAPRGARSASRGRLLFVSNTAGNTGPTRSLLLLLKKLQARYEITVLLPGHGYFSERLGDEGIETISLPALTKRWFPAMIRLFRRHRFDLVYANNTRSPSRLAFLAAVLARARFVCHVRSMDRGKGWFQLGYLRFADAVVAVSEACAASVGRFVPSHKLHVVYNGVPVPLGNGSGRSRRLRPELGIPEDAVVVLSVAHLCPRKGQEEAIRAFGQVVRNGLPRGHLCLAGSLERDAQYVSSLRSLITDLELEGRVHILGFRTEIPELLEDADIFLHTALEDPHPRSVIEAMAAGLPVLAFSVDGVAETVISGRTGVLVPKGDTSALARSLDELIRDLDRATELGRAGRERAARTFSDTETAEQVQSIIEEVLSG